MRKVLTLLIVLTLCMIPVTANAETADVLLQKYGIKANNSIEVEAAKLASLEEDLHILQADLNNKEAIGDVVDNTKSTYVAYIDLVDSDIYFAQASLNLLADKIENGGDLSVDELFKLEAQYRDTSAELDKLIEKRAVIDTSVAFLSTIPTATEADVIAVEEASKSVDKQKDAVAKAVRYSELGKINGVKHPLDNTMRITSKFGYRLDPILLNKTAFHYGLDFSARSNTKVLAQFNGTVSGVGSSASKGNYIVLNHGNGIQTMYYHLNKQNVKVGDTVRQYQTIGLSGSTGRSTGPHLHFSLYINGKAVDPEVLFK